MRLPQANTIPTPIGARQLHWAQLVDALYTLEGLVDKADWMSDETRNSVNDIFLFDIPLAFNVPLQEGWSRVAGYPETENRLSYLVEFWDRRYEDTDVTDEFLFDPRTLPGRVKEVKKVILDLNYEMQVYK